jgi:hypothetical protein
MPFAEDAGGVARALEHLRQRGGLGREAFAFQDGVGDAVLKFMAAGEQRGACGGAGGTHTEVLKAHALGVEAVEVRRFENGIAVGGEIAVALVVGEQEDDVRTFAREFSVNADDAEEAEKKLADHGWARSTSRLVRRLQPDCVCWS